MRVFKMSALLGNSFSSLLAKNFYIPTGFWSKFYLQNSTCFIYTSCFIYTKLSWRSMWRSCDVSNRL